MIKIRLLVADENCLFCAGVSALLKRYPEIEVVGKATNGRGAVKMAWECKPDVVLMNISISLENGIWCTRRIRNKHEDIKVLLVSECDDVGRVLQGLKAGASGYIPMSASASDLVSAIKTVHRGGYFLYPPLARKMVRGYSQLKRGSLSHDPYNNVTPMEREVLKLIAEGRQNAEIARYLGITIKTTIRHRNRVVKKLGRYTQDDPVQRTVHRHLINLHG